MQRDKLAVFVDGSGEIEQAPIVVWQARDEIDRQQTHRIDEVAVAGK